jgi:hypothetical protein
MQKWLSLLLLLNLIAIPAAAQTATPVAMRDPNALALASRALQALAGGTVIRDITLLANVTYTAGSDEEMGSATLVALGNQQSRVTLNLNSGQRQEIRTGVRGAWVDTNGTPHRVRFSNNCTDANWFFPALTLAAVASDPSLALSFVGQEVYGGQSVLHLVLSHVIAGSNPRASAGIQRWSTMHLYLDAGTLQPAALAFTAHPDQNGSVDIPIEVRFAAYRSFDGVRVPTRIQRSIQNSLVLDLTVTNAAVNSGVQANVFAIPAIAAGGAQ